MDGSFSLQSALERLLARCPKLRSFSKFQSLLKKGDEVNEDEVVNALVEVFVNPSYTIPLIGCFRAIADKVVVKTVELLGLVGKHNLLCNSRERVEEVGQVGEDGRVSDVENFIELYNGVGRGLDLHEHACFAFCRALDLLPFLLRFVEKYFEFAPPPFQRILKIKTSDEFGNRVLQAVRISYRLLLTKFNKFSEVWDLSPFFKLVGQLNSTSDNVEVIMDIRWCALQITSLTLKLRDKGSSNLGIGSEDAFSCLLRWKEFCRDVSLEEVGWHVESFSRNELESQNGCIVYHRKNWSESSVPIPTSQCYGVEPQIKRQRTERSVANLLPNDRSAGNPFVLTSTMKKSFEMMLLAVDQKWPVLLFGPTGSGKSALIRKLAQDSGNQVLSIHMDDQIDGRTLIGSYVCTEKPGEFRWQPGSLTQAVSKEYWVVFEDIDKAPSDVHSLILPLLEGAISFSTGHGQEIRVPENFRLFSTISTSKHDVSCITEGGSLLSVVWRKVMVAPSTIDDLQNIVKACYSSLEPLSEKLTGTYESVNSVILHQIGGYHSGNSSRFSSRDLLKWCKRIQGLIRFYGDILDHDASIRIFQEAVDVFAAFSSSAKNRLAIMKEIARFWELPADVLKTLYPSDKNRFQELENELKVSLGHPQSTLNDTQNISCGKRRSFIELRSSMHLVERIASSVKWNEPVLLVGETGTGKTTLVQELATRLDQKLTVLNLSQQTDVADLLGGYKPMDANNVYASLYKEFENVFKESYSLKEESNAIFFTKLQELLYRKDWGKLRKYFTFAVAEFHKSMEKKRKHRSEEEIKAWENFKMNLEKKSKPGMIFSFVEGAFVTAMKNGEWILLDEVNLAPPETLQRVIGVLEGEDGSLLLAERGDITYIDRHPNFRLFACMNPATDAGKRDLPFSLRSRFTEYYVDDVLDDDDLILFVKESFKDLKSRGDVVNHIVSFYKTAKILSEEKLQDGANQKPQYSLRSLYRALKYTEEAERYFGFEKAIYDGFCMFFVTLLDRSSAKTMEDVILKYLLGQKIPQRKSYDHYLSKRYTIQVNTSKTEEYVTTASVEDNLRNLACAIWTKNQKYPVLLQGPTSGGKTSLVRHLAAVTNHNFVRINNHEHTDLQEYLGSYIINPSGNLVFQEGVLVKAVRNGDWIVLDELNLAPSDVLEALNRLLDDNRELYVPELQESIRAHPNFMLFATQNPPGFYGGRKMLSRAFRNRFIEIHVDEIPEDELCQILYNRRKGLSEKMAKEMVDVMKKLQVKRQTSNIFAGKHGFITPRDLFRWADRFIALGGTWKDLAQDGYYLLAERCRDDVDKRGVRDVLGEMKSRNVLSDNMYNQVRHACSVSWTKSMLRLYFLVERCYKMREPVLLVGETGTGKTTVCQELSKVLGSELRILNCHQYTETSDFIGGFYPIRDRSRLLSDYKKTIEDNRKTIEELMKAGHLDRTVSLDMGQASSLLSSLNQTIKKYKNGVPNNLDITTIIEITSELLKMHQEWKKLFMWQDGPLVQAMRNGDLFLVDEISLADDSVLERLNSVLEPERTLSLAEKGGTDLEKIVAQEGFFLLATMNPGGDFGKKELSPALRNRFTEIWVPPVDDIDDLKMIASERFSKRLSSSKFMCILDILDPMLSFWKWFNNRKPGRVLTVRDLLSWVDFIIETEKILGGRLNINIDGVTRDANGLVWAFLHGAFLVLLDGLSLGTGLSKRNAEELREECLSKLLEQLKVNQHEAKLVYRMQDFGWGDFETNKKNSCSDSMQCDDNFGVHPFYIGKGSENCDADGFAIDAPTTWRNAFRVLRAMQLPKPVLLEGSPGVGKTTLIVALGKCSGHRVVRINLSEQTDMMDLLGSDLPVESGEEMKFAWSDGILLQALKEGSWVLLDELNLAPQSVLEGLNAILDHRAEVFIPELGRTFKCPSSFRVFACQNPSSQGGGRKGLPKSFLNRFTKVYVEELVDDDYLFICTSRYPSISTTLLSKLILFNKRLYEDTMLHRKFALEGSPWEFNLRDVFRSCQIIEGAPSESKAYCFLDVIYVQRMRTGSDRRKVLELYEQIFEVNPYMNPYPRIQLDSQYLYVGTTAIRRNCVQPSELLSTSLQILPGIRQSLEAAACCVEHQWMCILIGPASCGKTSLIRLLAQLTGNVLNEIHLSSGTDISELLGCFEQYNAFRNFHLVFTQIKAWVNEYCSLQVLSNEEDDSIFSKFTKLSRISCSASTFVEDINILSSLKEIIQCLERVLEDNILKRVLENNSLSVSWCSEELDKVRKTICKLQEEYDKGRFSAKFEWVTGALIRAVERGEWIVLENANCCNPTVLDRINSLVEPSGSITINECGVIDGRPVVLVPHANFRVFLTVNPRFGEVSRAMRNRGVEVFVMPPYWLMNENMRYSSGRVELNDVKRFLILSGIPLANLVNSMAKSHLYAKVEGSRFKLSITYLELSRWVQLFRQLLKSGSQPLWSLQTSWEHIYLGSLGEVVGGSIIIHVKNTYLCANEFCDFGSSLSPSLCLPGGWPMPLQLRDIVWCPKELSILTNCMYLEYLGARYASYKFQLARSKWFIPKSSTASPEPYLMDLRMLKETVKQNATLNYSENAQVHKKLAQVEKKLLFAANWTIEQATDSDLKLYLMWFSWFHSQLQRSPSSKETSQLQTFCEFFDSFVKSITLTMKHEIWKCVSESNDGSKLFNNSMYNLLPVRLSFHQWESEDSYPPEEAGRFKELLKMLRKLEEKFLNELLNSSLVGSPFDTLIATYSDLIEDHILFWKCLESSEFEILIIIWHIVLKSAAKLKVVCPEAVDNLLEESRSSDLHSEKSLLWVHGGHPILPCSSKIFEKQLEILELCEWVWPTTLESLEQVNDPLIGYLASVSVDMRFHFLKGISISLCIAGNSDEDEDYLLSQLDDVYQKLSQMYERIKLKEIVSSNVCASKSTVCCNFTDVFYHTPGYDTWRDTSPLIDCTSFSLDMELLLELSRLVLNNPKRKQQDLVEVSGNLKHALDFSLNFSSRPPQMFLSHQKLWWILDEWSSVQAASTKMASFVLDMWFRWHQSLWNYCPVSVKNFPRTNDYNISVPDVLLKPVVTASVFQILQSPIAIKDYITSSLKLRVASRNIWYSSHPGVNLPGFLLSTARSLFQQIVYAHEKSFDANHFAEVKSLLEKGNITVESPVSNSSQFIQLVGSLISKSSHHGLKESMHRFIEPLLHNLYHHCSSTEYQFNHGCAWMRLGVLRLKLLLSCDDMDPAMKYYYKHSKIAEKISSLKLEIQVREKCDYLAGKIANRNSDEKRLQKLKKLELEQRRLQRKIIFRSDFREFKRFMELKRACDNFLKRVTSDEFFLHDMSELYKCITSSEILVGSVEALNLQQTLDQNLDQGSNWQKMATGLIQRLSSDDSSKKLLSYQFNEYSDFLQPVLVALYEVKLGLSLILASVMQKKILIRIELQNTQKKIPIRVELQNTDMIVRSIYSFMRFPRVSFSEIISVELNTDSGEFPSYKLEVPTVFNAEDIVLLKKWLISSSDHGSDKQVSEACLYQNILVRVAHLVTNARLMDIASFKLLDEIFSESAKRYISIIEQEKTKQDYASQQYKFRPRAFELESIIELDISSLGKLFANESFSEWKEFLTDEEEVSKKENSEEDLNHMEDSSMRVMSTIHNQLFGTSNLVVEGDCRINDLDIKSSFTASHSLGIEMLRGLGCSHLVSLDAKLVPESFLRICLENEQIFNTSVMEMRSQTETNNQTAKDVKPSSRYNFYKDPNPTVMKEMVKFLIPLQQRICSLLDEYEDHPQLQKILDIVSMLLNIPLCTSLSKALSGLEFLVRSLELLKDCSKFSFSEQVIPIRELVSSWRKLELRSWPSLLREVQDQYEINAGKLWFPLYSVLRHEISPDVAAYKLSTIQSLEDFIRTSSIGEFRKRLQLLLAFLGQIKAGGRLEVKKTLSYDKENEEILYNTFGYYVQFLPKILAHIESVKGVIVKKLEDLLKPSQWERDTSLPIENFKPKRQKLRKIIKEYTVLLEQPVIVFLGQDAVKGANSQSQQCQNSVIDNVKNKIMMVDANFDLDQTFLNNDDGYTWYTGSIEKANSALGRNSQAMEDVGIPQQWTALWDTLIGIVRKAIAYCELWKDANKSQKTMRAFSELQTLLKNGGLSRDIFTEDEDKSWWFIEPSYDIEHLLLTQSRLSNCFSGAAHPSELERSSNHDLVAEWKMAIAYYFTSVESVLFTRQQIGMPNPCLQQFIQIQQDQQKAANKFAEQLRRLKECIYAFEKCIDAADENGSKFSIGQNQLATLKCMWQQKQVFDNLCAMSHEEVLLLKIFEKTHLPNCDTTIKNEANDFLGIIQIFIPELLKSKESLDTYLLGSERKLAILGPSQYFLISKQMEKLVIQNFDVIKRFETHLCGFIGQDVVKSSVKDILLQNFLEIFEKEKLLEGEFNSAMEKKNEDKKMESLKLDVSYQESLSSTFEHIAGAVQKLGSPSNDHGQLDKSLGKITSWGKIFDSFVQNLSLDQLCDKLLRTMFCAEKMVNNCCGEYSIPVRVEADFKQLRLCFNILLNFCDALLKELLALRKTVSVTTHILANIYALPSNGPAISREDKGDDATRDVSQEEEGTGMGEGVGRNDVSDQITDEDQLNVASEKRSDEQDPSGEAANQDEKGVEMMNEFSGDEYSVSEDSDEDTNPNDDADDDALDTKMGKTGEKSELVDEKPGNKDDDENPEDSNEKYETGSSVKEKDSSSNELRAKEDAPTTDDLGELDSGELDQQNGETGSQDDQNDRDDVDDMNLDKQESALDFMELKPDETNQFPNEDVEPMEVDDPEVGDEYDENDTHEDNQKCPTDETMVEPEANAEETDATSEKDESSRDQGEDTEMDTGLGKDLPELVVSNSISGNVPNEESSTQPTGHSKASDAGDIAPESNWVNSSDVHNEHAPIKGLPSNNTSDIDVMTSEASNNGKNAGQQPKSQLPRQDTSSVCKSQPNPYRSVGDALKEWEESVRVSVDLQEDDLELQDDIKNENADEFGYVSQYEKGTAQALGAATSEQIDKNANGNKTNEDGNSMHKDDPVEMEIEKLKTEMHPNSNSDSVLQNKVDDPMQLSGLEKLPDEGFQHNHQNGDPESMVEDLVFINKSYLSDDIHQLSKLPVNNDDMGKAQDPEEFSGEVISNATALWSKYELTTTRMSQELAEQLRLILEPTVASKLEGDYKTGKRINMKKVIPYIASDYRKDRIWLRRTRPNKRDYQVVIAVDDSSSMSKNRRGDVAIEALVTVCRAMSQLEMGNFAVASFGKEGNIKLLHDLDQPFTGEAGVKMISSLSFKQENTIADEPYVDLLKFLNNKLDTAVAKARLPSGQNPLEQLVLIIADGEVHERERLKRCMRDAIVGKRMVAFVLLDNAQDSIMDRLEVSSIEGNVVKFSKFKDTFPFPFYSVVRNIEELPRMLADLLRQWFELMQQYRD